MVTGNFKTHEVTIANGAAGEIDLSADASTEKIVKVNPGAASVRILLTPATSSAHAAVTDYLLPNYETEYEIGRGLDRLSFWNGSGGEVKVSVAVLF
jgi:hypothetical protein